MLMNLPRNLAALSKCCEDSNAKFVMGAVQIIDQFNGLYRAQATNGRLMAIVQGPFDEQDQIDARFKSRPFEPDDTMTVLVEGKAFALAMGKLKDRHPDVCFVTSGTQASLSSSDSSVVLTQVEGRFPDADAVFPKRRPLCRVIVDPKQLITLLTAAIAVNDSRVELLVYPPNRTRIAGAEKKGDDQAVDLDAPSPLLTITTPIGAFTKNDLGQCFDGLLVPLSLPKDDAA